MKIENGIKSETTNISDYKTHYIEMSMDGNIIQNKILEDRCNDN